MPPVFGINTTVVNCFIINYLTGNYSLFVSHWCWNEVFYGIGWHR